MTPDSHDRAEEEGPPSPLGTPGVEGFDARMLQAIVGARLFGGTPEPVKIGRFTVLRRLGAGGMGVVYAAYDEMVDRKVAIKLLQGMRVGEEAGDRLLREAQALGRLSHPNVIQVYEVGVHEERVFVAMEFVDGTTLDDWDPEAPLKRVLDMYVQAGQGLAAAHRAGLVHRDFKPDNVLVGHDGRARVLDFGLARAADDTGPDPASSAELQRMGVDTTGDRLVTPLTRTGAVMGTPAYMAPEQHLGEPTDPRTDQFSFCVALWERVYGERPFPGKTLDALALSVTGGELREPPPSRSAPSWLRRALLRGLSTHPGDRFDSMDELIAELERDRRRPRRVATLSAITLLTGAVAAAVAVGPLASAPAQASCEDAGERLVGVWDDEIRGDARLAFEATGLAYASDAWASTAKALDAYAGRWVEVRTQACERRLVEGTTSEEVYARQLVCLTDRRDSLELLGEQLRQADIQVIRQARAAAEGLPPIDDCADEVMLGQLEIPEDEATRAARGDVHRKILEATSQTSLGRYEDALALATEAVGRARELEHDRTLSAALLRLGRVEAKLRQWDAAETSIREAQRLADRAGDDRRRMEAQIDLVWVVGHQHPDYDASLSMARDAIAAMDRLGEDPGLRAELENSLGTLAKAQGRNAEAIAHHRKALELRQQALGDEHTGTAISHNNLCVAYRRNGQPDQARTHCLTALQIFESVLGPGHPHVASPVINLGNLILAQAVAPGTPEAASLASEAEPYYRRAIEIKSEHYGREHPTLATPVNNLAEALLLQGKHVQALEAYQRASKIRGKEYGEQHVKLAGPLVGEAKALLALERQNDAIEVLTRALAILGRAEHPNPSSVGEAEFAMARARASTNPAAARAAAERAAAAYREAGDGEAAALRRVEAWLDAKAQ